MKYVHSVTRRRALVLGVGAAGAVLTGSAHAAPARPVVVELFTSQGCNSCPPADAVLSELRSMPGVIALAYHVDYWDYLGWKDTLGGASFSQRQYDYAKARGDMDVYTPQIIVNGAAHYVGSKRSKVMQAVENAGQETFAAAVSLAEEGSEIAVAVSGAEFEGDAMLWLLPIQSEAAVKIERGENAGRTITYNNVVRAMVPAGMWSGEPVRFALPADAVLAPECDGCVALLQRGKAGPVVGAATWGRISA